MCTLDSRGWPRFSYFSFNIHQTKQLYTTDFHISAQQKKISFSTLLILQQNEGKNVLQSIIKKFPENFLRFPGLTKFPETYFFCSRENW